MSGAEGPARVLRIIARMNIGGPAYHVSLLSGLMPSDRYETILLTGALGAHEGSFEGLAERYGAATQMVPGLRPELAPLSDVRALIGLGRQMRRCRPHIVHTHTAKAGTLGRLAALLTPGVRPLLVHTYHGHVLKGYFGALPTAVFRWIERLLARRSDCLIGVSAATVDELVEMRIAPREKFRVLPIGLDLEPFLAANSADGEGFRSEIGASTDDVVAVFVGRLVPIKRVDLAIEALALARAEGAPIRLAIVGDGELRAELERQTARLGVTEWVRFVGFRTDLPSIAAGSDVAVLTSDNEGTPVALIEAAAAARPAVATAVGGVAEIVTPDTGIVVRAGDAEAVSRALVRLAADGGLRRRMGEAARPHVRARYSADRLVRDVTSLYDELRAR